MSQTLKRASSLNVSGAVGIRPGRRSNVSRLRIRLSKGLSVLHLRAEHGSPRRPTVQLTTETAITGSPLTFWVNGVQGGSAEVGTVSSSGLYTAPAITPSPNNIVTITSLATHFRRTHRAG